MIIIDPLNVREWLNFFGHIIGKFNIKLSTLRECPAKWLDRALDEKRVEDISRSVALSPAIIHNGQPWLAIADVTKEDVTRDKSIIKGAKLELTGGLHRHAAVKKVGSILSQSQQFWVTKCFALLLGNSKLLCQLWPYFTLRWLKL